MCLGPHGWTYLTDTPGNEYSLKNRFETAYCFNTPQSHTTYTGTVTTQGDYNPITREFDYYTTREKTAYFADPYVTYGVIGAYGLCLMWLTGSYRKRKIDELKNTTTQRTR